jgi:hypothetical protein
MISGVHRWRFQLLGQLWDPDIWVGTVYYLSAAQFDGFRDLHYDLDKI